MYTTHHARIFPLLACEEVSVEMQARPRQVLCRMPAVVRYSVLCRVGGELLDLEVVCLLRGESRRLSAASPGWTWLWVGAFRIGIRIRV
jgi:hypothetical protein